MQEKIREAAARIKELRSILGISREDMASSRRLNPAKRVSVGRRIDYRHESLASNIIDERAGPFIGTLKHRYNHRYNHGTAGVPICRY